MYKSYVLSSMVYDVVGSAWLLVLTVVGPVQNAMNFLFRHGFQNLNEALRMYKIWDIMRHTAFQEL